MPTENTMANETDTVLAQQLLVELRAVSEKSHRSRFSHSFETAPSTQELKSGQSFLDCTPENPTLNQYWYSKNTVEVLCNAIIEKINDPGGMGGKVAFLSTPTLYFALPPVVQSHCFLFDVSI